MEDKEKLEQLPYISIVMPIYNENKYIENCINSLLKQDYPLEKMEWIFVDGNSKDETVAKIKKYQDLYPKLIKILNNPKKIVPCAMNIGIKESKGEYIIRLDAHADYDYNYISKCIEYLKKTNADNVGGIAITKSKGFIGNTIAKMLSCKFGVGNSEFRTEGKEGYVDTVPFGAFKRDVFEKYGFYDERLIRNQDNELNYRIRKNNGKIYLSDQIKFSYYCRDSIKGIVNMAIKNGMWNIITMKLCPGSMGIRHFIPMLFLCSLFVMPILSIFSNLFLYLFVIEMGMYFILDLYFSKKMAKNIKEFFLLLYLFPLFHITYGYGSIKGILKILIKQF